MLDPIHGKRATHEMKSKACAVPTIMLRGDPATGPNPSLSDHILDDGLTSAVLLVMGLQHSKAAD